MTYCSNKIIRFIITFLILALANHGVISAPTIEDYGLLPQFQDMSVSPNGELIAYRRTTKDLDFLSVLSLKSGKRINAVDLKEVKPLDLYFVNDETIFIRASQFTRVPGFKGKFELSTGLVMNVESAKIKQLLIPGDGVVYPGQSGLGDVVGMSKDGKYLYMPAYLGTPTFDFDPGFGLLRVKANGRGKPRLKKSGSVHSRDYFVNAEGEVLAREEFIESSNTHTVTAFHEKKKVEIFKTETPYITEAFTGLTEDEKHLIMLRTSRAGRMALYKVALKNGEIEGPLYERDDADIEYTIQDINRKVYGIRYSGLTPSYKFFDENMQQRADKILEMFPQHSVWFRDISPDRKHIVVYVEGSQAAGDYYLFSEGKKPAFLMSSYKNIKIEDIHPIGKILIAARDGLTFPTLLTIPRDKLENMKNLPVVMLPHGGPASHDNIGFDFMAQALAQQGYLVVQPQFRGSDGFGARFELAGYGEWGGKMQDDITDTLKTLIKKGIADSSRVCIVGASYGGYAALAGGAFTPELYKCVVSINGIGDLHSFRRWVRSETGRSSGALAYWETQIGGDDYTKEQARERSPENSANKFTAPVLLIHGKNDEIVPISQSNQMARALKKAGKSVKLIKLDGDDHHLSKSKTRLEALRAIVDFVKSNI